MTRSDGLAAGAVRVRCAQGCVRNACCALCLRLPAVPGQGGGGDTMVGSDLMYEFRTLMYEFRAYLPMHE